MRIRVQDWLMKNKVSDKFQRVMCIDEGYAPHFRSGEFYNIIEGKSIKSEKFRVSSMDDQIINKLFIPIQGDPEKLTLTPRDKLLIKVRTNVSV